MPPSESDKFKHEMAASGKKREKRRSGEQDQFMKTQEGQSESGKRARTKSRTFGPKPLLP